MTDEEKKIADEQAAAAEANATTEGASEHADAAAEAQEAATPSALERLTGKVKELYPDDNFENDNAVVDKALSHIDDREKFYKDGMSVNDKLAGIYKSSPELEGITLAIANGVPIRAAIAKYFSPEDLTPQDGDDDLEAHKQAVAERSKKLADKDKFNKEVESNLAASEGTLREFAQENGLDEDSTLDLIDTVSGIMDDLYKGKLSKDLLAHVHSSKTKNADIEKATESAFRDGKNSKIEAVRVTDKKSGDNIPVLNGGGSEGIKEEKPAATKSKMDRLIEKENKKWKLN